MGWSWYLGNDFIFYLISPFLVFLYYRRAVAGWAALAALMLGSFVSSWVVVTQHGCGLFMWSRKQSDDDPAG